MKITLGTRGSQLAIRQADPLVAHLRSQGCEVEWKNFTTRGDRWQDGPLDKQMGRGFFTGELESALVAGEVDLLVHSYKDVALERPEGICPLCIPARENPQDWLVMRPDAPSAPVIGTSSERRRRFLQSALPQASFPWIRGNVPTRIQKVREGELRGSPLHGTVLAAAGLLRLDLDLHGLQVHPIPFSQLLPAPAQGALLAESLAGRQDLQERLQDLHDPVTARCAALERKLLARLGGGCQQPLGTLAILVEDGSLWLRAAFADPQGLRWAEARGSDDEALTAAIAKELGW